MALLQCPACGKDVSDEAEVCPHCGHPIKKKKSRKGVSGLKTGAIINLIGGIGYVLMFVVAIILAAGDSESKSSSGSSVSVKLNPAGGDFGNQLYFCSTFIILALITILSIVILLNKSPKKRRMLPLCGIQLLLALVAAVVGFVTWGGWVCCGAWILLWASVAQLIGSMLCMNGALRLDE